MHKICIATCQKAEYGAASTLDSVKVEVVGFNNGKVRKVVWKNKLRSSR